MPDERLQTSRFFNIQKQKDNLLAFCPYLFPPEVHLQLFLASNLNDPNVRKFRILPLRYRIFNLSSPLVVEP